MFIHFAFGQLGKAGEVEQQTDNVLQHILAQKRLKVSRCVEFLPGMLLSGAKSIPMERFGPSDSGLSASLDLNEIADLPDAPPVTFLPVDVPMICFIKIAFNQLRNTSHQHEYGRFGVVLSDDFVRKCHIQPVEYYTEVSVLSDPRVQRWNKLTRASGASKDEKAQLEKAILTFRKPASLFPALQALSVKVSRDAESITAQYLTYDRYPEGYDFTAENEWRLAFDESEEFLSFGERDLYMVIVPDTATCERVEDFFKRQRDTSPQIKVFPQD